MNEQFCVSISVAFRQIITGVRKQKAGFWTKSLPTVLNPLLLIYLADEVKTILTAGTHTQSNVSPTLRSKQNKDKKHDRAKIGVC